MLVMLRLRMMMHWGKLGNRVSDGDEWPTSEYFVHTTNLHRHPSWLLLPPAERVQTVIRTSVYIVSGNYAYLGHRFLIFLFLSLPFLLDSLFAFCPFLNYYLWLQPSPDEWHILLIKTKNNNDTQASCRLRETACHSSTFGHIHLILCMSLSFHVHPGHTNLPQRTTCCTTIDIA